MKFEDKLPEGRKLAALMMVVLIMTCAVLIWSGWQTYWSFSESKKELERFIRISNLHGTVVHLDEVLTMSAQMSVSTGDLQWEQRYRKFEPLLDVAIEEVLTLTSDEYAVKAAAKVYAANIMLVEMENHVFDLVRENHKEEAKEFLFSDKYIKQKQIYTKEMKQFTDAISNDINAKLQDKQRNILYYDLSVILPFLFLIVAWLIVYRYLGKWRMILLASNNSLAQKKEELTNLNLTLDQRVFERTNELSKINKSLSRKAKSIELMKNIAIAANKSDSINESINICMKMVCTYMGWPIGHYYVLANDGSKVLVTSKIWYLEHPKRFEIFRKITEKSRFELGIGLPGRVLSSGEPLWIANLWNDTNFPRANLAENIGVSSGFAFPIKIDKEVIGVLEFFSESITEPDLDELEIMNHIGTQLSHVYDRKLAENTLQESNERFRASFVNAAIGMVLVTLEHKIIEANPAFCTMLGYSKEKLTGILFKDITHPDDVETSIDHHNQLIAGEIDNYHLEKRYLHKQGHEIWASLSVSLVRDNNTTPLYAIAQIQDIIVRKQAELELSESEKKYRSLLEYDPDGMVIVNDRGVIEIVNQELQKMTGYVASELIGQTVEILIPERFSHHKQQRDGYINLSKPKVRYMGEGKELFVQRKDGSDFPAEISLGPLNTKDGLNISVAIRDITERKKSEDLLTFQATHDALTGLVNRREFERRVERLLATDEEGKGSHALCYLDLDQFKIVNDTCGHIAGDELLRQISALLLNTVRHRDTLARLGGDEFGVLMEHCPFDDAHRVATSILNVINDYQFTWEEQTFRVGASIGLVPITDATLSLTELLKDADAACYIAKDKGRNCIHVYRDEDAETAQRHGEMQWVARINQALKEDRFCLYAQSITPLNDSTETHYELLIRMKDKDGKIILPGSFLPAAERYNLIEQIDRWVVEQAFGLLANNPDFQRQINFISINISGQSLTRSDFLDLIVNQLDKTGVETAKICFEITETAAISNLSAATKFISVLKGMGCQFALDDFGSGLSSFGYLKNLPVDYLKIDGMFVKDIVDDPIDHAMVKSINEIGHVMGMQTIAEFVENDEIKGMLREIGVNYAQGYGIHKPQPFSELLD